ncbi:hypothetical protein ACFY7V_03700 [[Kitasatospora] papulosa]
MSTEQQKAAAAYKNAAPQRDPKAVAAATVKATSNAKASAKAGRS